MVVCQACSRKIKRDGNNAHVCVMCREPIEYVMVAERGQENTWTNQDAI
jgi:hypothetical protein